MRGNYVDVFGQSAVKKTPAVAPNIFDVMPRSQTVPANMFIPSGTYGQTFTCM